MPNIFLKKSKNKNLKIKKFFNHSNEVFKPKKFLPFSLEWSDAIYNFNKNKIKAIPIYSKIINKIIKSYFSIYRENFSIYKNKVRIRRKQIRFKRLSVNRILVSKAEIKHTNDKAIITMYVYNAEKRYL